MRNNKYSNLKILNFAEKLDSFAVGRITAPIYVRIKPTNVCDMDCFWCVYAQSNRKSVENRRPINDHTVSGMHTEMKEADSIPTTKLFEILDDLKEMGVKALTFSGGGEPLVHKDICGAMQKTLDLGIDLSIITNGRLLTGRRAEILAQAKWVRVSMDYFSEREIREFRRVDGSVFQKVIGNLQDFAGRKSRECDLAVNYIVHKANHNTLRFVAASLKGFGVNNVRFSPMWVPDFRAHHEPLAKAVTEQLQEIQSICDENFSVNSTYNIDDPAHYPERRYHRCWVMQTVPSIGADQNVYGCHNVSYSKHGLIGSIKDRSFKDLWFSDEAKAAFEALDPCKVCRHQCASDAKNVLVTELLETSRDNFV